MYIRPGNEKACSTQAFLPEGFEGIKLIEDVSGQERLAGMSLGKGFNLSGGFRDQTTFAVPKRCANERKLGRRRFQGAASGCGVGLVVTIIHFENAACKRLELGEFR